MIINSHGTVLSDYGAADAISNITFDVLTNQSDLQITFSFNHHMNNPPLVQPMNHGLYLRDVMRGTHHDWIANLRVAPETLVDLPNHPSGLGTLGLSSIDTNREYRFLVELLH